MKLTRPLVKYLMLAYMAFILVCAIAGFFGHHILPPVGAVEDHPERRW